MDESIYWFMFILGLGTFASFVLIARALLKATPNALDKLTATVDETYEVIGEHVSSDELFQVNLLKTVVEIEKVLHDIKYQHDHPDNFNFGTIRTNNMLREVHDKLIAIDAKLNRN
jgi:hypothetical protein